MTAALSFNYPLLPFLRQLHLSPDTPNSLRELTFPELFFYPDDPSEPERKLTSAQLLDLEQVSPQLQQLYASGSATRRLFALLDGEQLALFTIGQGKLFFMGRSSVSSIGDHSLFLSCERPLLERLFPSPLWEEVVALASSEPLSIAESSPIEALRCWILPQEEQGPLLEALFDQFPDFAIEQGATPLAEIAASLDKLGATYNTSGESARTIKCYEQSLIMRKQLYGKQPHPDIATSLDNLGTTYNTLGEGAPAVDYYEQSLVMKKQLYGDWPHPDIATSLDNLGTAYNTLGESARAIDYHKQSLEMRRLLYDNLPHFDIATSLSNLGAVYSTLGESVSAIRHFQESYEILIKIVGKDHPNTKKIKEQIDALQKEWIDALYKNPHEQS